MRILILDNAEPFAHMLAGQLQRLEPSFDVTAVTTATAAREAVQAATTPFDVFLLDQRLDGSDVDGVTLMQELKETNPTGDTIILTGYDDPEAGLRAFEAGAYRYLIKPFDTRELVFILKALDRVSGIRFERNWLQVLTEIATEMQGTTTVQAVADAIAHGALRFGFQRARLRLFAQEGQETSDDQEMVGVSQAGVSQVAGFEGLRAPLARLFYSQRAITAGQPLFFRGRELGPGGADKFYATQGVQPPVGEWVKIPILSGEHRIGSLTLDNGDRNYIIDPQRRSQLALVLGLFGKRAAAAIEQARLHEQTRHQAETQALLNQVIFAVTEQAAQGDLNEILVTLRDQVRDRLQLNVDDFAVALFDQGEPVSRYLDFYCEYKYGKQQMRHWCAYPDDPAIARIVQVIEDTRTPGDFSPDWLGVPLIVSGKVIGAIILQSESTSSAFNVTQRDQLAAIAQYVGGIIRSVYQAGRAKEQNRRKNNRNKLIDKLQQLAHTDENHFWHAVLTFATHRDGLSFNRAVLFRYDPEGRAIQGQMGIGHLDRESWEKDAVADVAEGEAKSFDAYLDLSYVGHLHTTPLAKTTLDWQRKLSGDERDPFRRVRVQGTHQVLAAAELKEWLPGPEFISKEMRPAARCALVPWKDGKYVAGVLLVDNAMDDKPVRQEDLVALENLLTQASQILDEAGEVTRLRRQGTSYERILKLSQQLMAQATDADLKTLLKKLCQEALDITKADFVVLYPLGLDGVSYDVKNITTAGVLTDEGYLAKNKPRQQGVAAYVLRTGRLVINDVTQSQFEFDGAPVSQQPFIKREQVAAFIGVPIRATATGRSLGVFYLDYRQPQSFSESDILPAEQLASVSGMVIGNAYRVEQEVERFILRESSLLQAIQEESLAADTSEIKVISVVLKQAQELFGRQAGPTLSVWEPIAGQEAVQEAFHYYQLNLLGNCQRVVNPSNTIKEIMGKAFESGEPSSTGDTRAVPVKTSYRKIGCISITRVEDSFTPRVERLASATAVALDNVRRQDRLHAVLEAVQQIVAPTDLRQTLDAVITSARKASRRLECVTLWYRDPISPRHQLGAQWGLLPDASDPTISKGADAQEQQPIVQYVMGLTSPLWADDLRDETADKQLRESTFVKRQGLGSVAAFPLWVNDECIGALFFNYRRKHRFSPGERATLKIFAAVAATSIREAQLLEQAQKNGKRLYAALKVVDAVGTELNLDAVLRQVLTALKKHFDKPDAEVQPYVMLYNEEDMLELPAVAREFDPVDNPKYREQLRLPLNGSQKGIVCRIARKSRELGDIHVDSIGDVKDDPDCLPFNSKTVSLLCAGLASTEGQTDKNRLWGVLAISSPSEKAFDDQDTLLLKLAAQQALIAMKRAEQAVQMTLGKRKQTVMAWQSEIAHAMKDTPQVLESIKSWFEIRRPSVPGVKDCVDLLTNHAAALREMLNAEVPTLEVFELAELLKEVKKWIADKEERWNELSVEYPLHRQDLMLYCDRRLLRRSLQNIIINAAEAMAFDGKITLISREFAESGIIEIEVRDTGPGIPKENRSKIGREMWSSKEGPNRGTGLYKTGLFMEMMDGSLQLLPDLPDIKGARISLRVPSGQAKTSIDSRKTL